jgi:hypothetical protein
LLSSFGFCVSVYSLILFLGRTSWLLVLAFCLISWVGTWRAGKFDCLNSLVCVTVGTTMASDSFTFGWEGTYSLEDGDGDFSSKDVEAGVRRESRMARNFSSRDGEEEEVLGVSSGVVACEGRRWNCFDSGLILDVAGGGVEGACK